MRPRSLSWQPVLAGAGRPLFVALQVDEVRFQHPAMRAPEVPVEDMVRLIRQAPSTTLVLNNLKVEHALPLMESGVDLSRVYLDTNAMDMPFDGLRSLVTPTARRGWSSAARSRFCIRRPR